MRINEAGLAIIRNFEGLRLKAYRCPAGKLTIGYGHTGPDVFPELEITKEKAEELLSEDTNRISQAIRSLLKRELNDNQFSALVSFAYNCGTSALSRSKLLKLINSKEDPTQEFLKWNKCNGKVIPGLSKRRSAEAQLFDFS